MEEADMDVVVPQLCVTNAQTEVTIDEPQRERATSPRLCTKAPSRAGSAGLRGLLELAVLRVSDVRGAVKLNTRQGNDARLATLTTLAKAGQASWCSGEDWIQEGA